MCKNLIEYISEFGFTSVLAKKSHSIFSQQKEYQGKCGIVVQIALSSWPKHRIQQQQEPNARMFVEKYHNNEKVLEQLSGNNSLQGINCLG